MRRADRLFQIVQLLRARKLITAAAQAARSGVYQGPPGVQGPPRGQLTS